MKNNLLLALLLSLSLLYACVDAPVESTLPPRQMDKKDSSSFVPIQKKGGIGRDSSNVFSSIEVEWQFCYGGSDADIAESIQQTSDGGYIIAGSTYSKNGDVSGNHGDSDYWLLKIDKQGKIEWQRCYGSSGIDYCHCVQQTRDGGYILVGEERAKRIGSTDGDVEGNHGDNDAWILKLDARGGILWQRCLGSIDYEVGYGVRQSADGGYIVVGKITDHYNNSTLIVKLDADGCTQWEKYYVVGGNDLATWIEYSREGGYIISGYSQTSSYSWLIKIGSNGEVEWQQRLSDVEGGIINKVQQNPEGDYIACGIAPLPSQKNWGSPTKTMFVIKLDVMGRKIWQQFLSIYSSCAKSLCFTPDGGCLVVGYISGLIRNNRYEPLPDLYIVKLNSAGYIVSEMFMGSDIDDVATDIQPTIEGGFVVAGYGSNRANNNAFDSHGYMDFWVLKLREKTQ